MTEPYELPVHCRDCTRPTTTRLIGGRCTRCNFAHEIVAYATSLNIATTIVRTDLVRARVSTTGADGRPAWLDTMTDVRYLARDLEYQQPSPKPTPIRPKRWARQHDHCANCGTTSRAHRARGLCTTCWDRHCNRGARLDRNPDRASGNVVRMAA